MDAPVIIVQDENKARLKELQTKVKQGIPFTPLEEKEILARVLTYIEAHP